MIYIVNVIYFLLLIALYRVAFGSFLRLRLHHIFIMAFLVLIFLASADIYYNWIKSSEFLISVYIVPVIYLFSACVFGYILRFRNYQYQGVTGFDRTFAKLTPLISLLLVGIIGLYLYDIGLNNVAIIFAILNPGQITQAMELRLEGMSSNITPILTTIYGYLRASFGPVYIFSLFALKKAKLVSSIHFTLTFVCFLGFTLATAAKAPSAYLLLGLMIVFYLLKPNVRVREALYVALLIAVLLLLVAFIYPILHGVGGRDSIFYAAEMLYRRLVFVPSYVSSLYFEYFGSDLQFSGCDGNRLMSVICGDEYRRLSSEVYTLHYGADGPQGRVNASFFATFYAYWGIQGVVFGTFLVGFVVSLVEYLIGLFRYGSVTIAVKALCCIALAQALMTDFFSILIGRGFLLMPVIYVLSVGLYLSLLPLTRRSLKKEVNTY